MRIATKYPRIAARYFESSGRQAEVIEVKGSVELAPISGLAEGIVDLTASGRTLRENHLEVREVIADCTARLVANRVSHKLRQADDRRPRDAASGRRPMQARHFTLESRDRGDVDALAEAMRGLVEPPGAVTAAVAEILDAGAQRRRPRGARADAALRQRGGARETSACPPEQIAAAPERARRATCAPGSMPRSRTSSAWRRRRCPATSTVDMPQGQSVTIRELPVRRAGAYVPGGRAAYPSSVVMCCVPARVAGVERGRRRDAAGARRRAPTR